MRVDGAEFVLWKRLRADDHFVYGGTDKHKLRCQQHIELGDSRSDEYCHHARDIHVHIGKRLNEHEPDGDDHLHADGNQCRGRDHVYANRYRKCGGRQANDQLVQRQPCKYYFRFEQYAELGDDRGNEYCHHAGDIHIHIRE
jgi:hypothetical protein